MTYIITKTNGNKLTTIPDGSFDTGSTSLTLIGKDSVRFGQYLNNNFVGLLENFASGQPPKSVIAGQIWFDTTVNKIKVYDGSSFNVVGGSSYGTSAPTSLGAGDTWVNSSTNQLYFSNGSSVTLVGPAYTQQQGICGFVIVDVKDASNNSHVIAKVMIAGQVVAVLSKDSFTLSSTNPITGFNLIGQGFTQSSNFVKTIDSGSSQLTSSPIVLTLDVTGYTGDQNTLTTFIETTLTTLAPPAEYVIGTIARIHCTELTSVSPITIDRINVLLIITSDRVWKYVKDL